MLPAPPLVLTLDDPACAARAETGGKAAHLAQLAAAGFPVPAGFAVTTHAYAAFLAAAGGLGADLLARAAALAGAAPAALEDEAEALRALVERAPVPGDVTAAVAQALGALAGHPAHGGPSPAGVRVAVRSSGTAEDLHGASFAGMHDTFLDVPGDLASVLAAVRRCWASLWTGRALAYRRDRGFDHRDARIAVLVQRMVDAEAAGVLFTANPLTRSRDELVVNASWGLGEAVVSGEVTPDEWVVRRAGLAVARFALGEKEVRLGPGGALDDVPDELRAVPCLADAHVAELCALALRVEETRGGRPQDIEWALAGGRLHLLQARDVTGAGFD